MELKFIGCGDAFSYEFGNNAATFRHADTVFFLDMGQGIFQKAEATGVLNGAKSIVIFITHLHLDHIGSLGEAICYCLVFHPEISLTIVYPKPEEMKKYMGLYPIDKVKIANELSGVVANVKYEAVIAKHIANSYAYFLTDNEGMVYYSGDNSELNEKALSLLKEEKLNGFYQDCAGISSAFHIGLEELASKIPDSLKDKVTIMHLHDKAFAKACLDKGFRIAKL